MASFKILESQVPPKKVVLVDPGYPYGKKPYMGGSVVGVAAQLMSAGHSVDLVDFNIDNPSDKRVVELFSTAEVIGVSVMGSPGIPGAIQLINRISSTHPHTQLVVGGQVVSHFSPEQFKKVFGSKATQIANTKDLANIFGDTPSAYKVSFQPVWERMGDDRLRAYLSHEFALVLSQGCIYNCDFCSAQKGQKETFRNLQSFKSDLLYLLSKAKAFGLTKLECYASSLDFFQTPKTIFSYMEVMSEVQKETGVKIKTRCLTCMNTFLSASKQREDFAELIHSSGLWCLGFGVDGPTEEVWQEQHKGQNKTTDVKNCYNLCQQLGVRAEVLTVMGYPNDTPKRLWQTTAHLSSFVRRWPNTVLRPYVAREVMPGNNGWKTKTQVVEKLVANPQLFFNLDICGLANHTTHPNSRWQRWLVNVAYLYIILRYAPSGRCATSPLFPQGSGGPLGWFAKLANRFMPFDR
jgi:hypothetical protein